jgi:hypothetical protein
MQPRKVRYEILLGLTLLMVSSLAILWIYQMVFEAPEVGALDRGDMKQWSMVLILLSITTLFMGSVSGYLLGKYLQVEP